MKDAKVECLIIAVEYELDALLMHHLNKPGCDCIGPLTTKRVKKCCRWIQTIRAELRRRQGSKQVTLTTPGSIKSWTGDDRKGKWGRGLKRKYDCMLRQ